MSIKIVVDVRGTKRDGERKQIRKVGMEDVLIPSHCPFPRDEVFARFLKLLRDRPGKKVFVHCRLGDDRDGMMIASYRMAIEGWSAEEAMKEMQTFGFTRGHHFISPGLARYEKHFPEHLKRIQSSRNFAPRRGQREPSKRARLSAAITNQATPAKAGSRHAPEAVLVV